MGVVTGRRLRALSCAIGVSAGAGSALAQSWTRLIRNPPASVNMMLLLSDGTVMASNNNGSATIGRAWYRLTPDSHGSYVNGTWTTLTSMIDTRLYYSSQVLMDGRVFVAGGEYGTGGAKAEVYDPVGNTWTTAPIPTTILNPAVNSPVTGGPQRFSDSNSEILPSGVVMITPVSPAYARQTVMYNPATGLWSNGPNLFRGSYQDEASWVKLPDDTILTIDPFGTNSERYSPATNTWINDGTVPVALYDPFGSELGAALLLPNGKAFFLGSTGQTALYTPTGTASPGAWAAGPVIPGSHGCPDAPAAMMVNGKVLCAVSPVPTSANHFPTPTTFYEYDPVANSFASVGAPTGATESFAPYRLIMLDLPDGNVLYSRMSTDVYVYTPAGAPLAAGKPTVLSVGLNGDGSYHMTGRGLNGISEGASYGDDAQMNSNYPIVRVNHSNGNVYFARTYNWSSTSVTTGTQVVSTEFRLPGGMPPGSYTLTAIANGIASDPFDASCGAPTFSVTPVSQTACLAGPVSFSVTASGAAPLAYQWRRGTTNLSNGGAFSGATTDTLTISPVGASDAGTVYNCVVSNACGSIISSSATLSVCAADADCDGQITPADVGVFVNSWFSSLQNGTPPPAPGDYDGNGVVDSSDIAGFVNAWFSALATGC